MYAIILAALAVCAIEWAAAIRADLTFRAGNHLPADSLERR